jgi:hypothetical protein
MAPVHNGNICPVCGNQLVVNKPKPKVGRCSRPCAPSVLNKSSSAQITTYPSIVSRHPCATPKLGSACRSPPNLRPVGRCRHADAAPPLLPHSSAPSSFPASPPAPRSSPAYHLALPAPARTGAFTPPSADVDVCRRIMPRLPSSHVPLARPPPIASYSPRPHIRPVLQVHSDAHLNLHVQLRLPSRHSSQQAPLRRCATDRVAGAAARLVCGTNGLVARPSAPTHLSASPFHTRKPRRRRLAPLVPPSPICTGAWAHAGPSGSFATPYTVPVILTVAYFSFHKVSASFARPESRQTLQKERVFEVVWSGHAPQPIRRSSAVISAVISIAVISSSQMDSKLGGTALLPLG